MRRRTGELDVNVHVNSVALETGLRQHCDMADMSTSQFFSDFDNRVVAIDFFPIDRPIVFQ